MNTFRPTSCFASTLLVLLGLTFTASASTPHTPTLETSTPQTSLKQLAQTESRSFVISQAFKPLKRKAAPLSAGGATRGESCLKGNKQLTSLIPQDRGGLTYSSNPTFYWFVPQSPATTAKFLLLGNDDADVVYETSLRLPQQAGIISFNLPPTAQLEIGKQYHWYLVVSCSQTDQSANPSVEGWVERIAPEAAISTQLEKADSKERAKIYANNGIWHEAVTTLAKLRQTSPNDTIAAAGWGELLKSVGLDAITAEPLLDANLSKN